MVKRNRRPFFFGAPPVGVVAVLGVFGTAHTVPKAAVYAEVRSSAWARLLLFLLSTSARTPPP
jgi:hypothetical protein